MIYRRGDVWYVNAVAQDGRRVHKSTGETDKARAKVAAYAILGTAPRVSGGITIEEACLRCRQERWAHLTSGARAFARAWHIGELLGLARPLASVTAADIVSVKEQLTAEGREITTAVLYLASFRTVMTRAARFWDAIPKVPAFDMAQPDNARTRTFSKDEEARVLAELEKMGRPEVAEFFRFLLQVGCRFGEAQSLTAGDVCTHEGVTYVTFRKETTKTKRQRQVPIGPSPAGIILARAKAHPTGTLWPDLASCSSVHRYFRQALAACGLGSEKELCFHACRHTRITRMLAAGVQLIEAAAVAGHTNLATTRRYTHLTGAALARTTARDL